MTNRKNTRFAVWLRDALPRCGFETQQDFARTIGVRPETISYWMGGRAPGDASRRAIADALGVSREFIDDLLDSYVPSASMTPPIQAVVDQLLAMPPEMRDDAIMWVKIGLRLMLENRLSATQRKPLPQPPDE